MRERYRARKKDKQHVESEVEEIRGRAKDRESNTQREQQIIQYE